MHLINLIIFKHSQHLELDARLLAINAEVYGVSRSHNSASMIGMITEGGLGVRRQSRGVALRASKHHSIEASRPA